MRSATARSGIILALAALLQSCGGGGGDDGNQPGSRTRVTVNTTNLSIAATPGNAPPMGSVTLSVTNPPAAGLYVEGTYTAVGIDTVDFISSGATQATLQIMFRSPGSLQNNTYVDTIQLRVCLEQPCVTQIAGSPLTITTSYVVSGNGTSTATIDRNDIQIAANADEVFNRSETVVVALSSMPASGIHVQINNTWNAIQGVTSQTLTGGGSASVNVNIQYRSANQLSAGTYHDTVTVTICYDPSCVRQVQGSPFTVSSGFGVGAVPEPGATPLVVTSRVALPHNIVDAEFSKALNRIVMVGNYPANALYVYDVATGTEQQQLLARIPTAVSISPDGLSAAVGHDALITIVDLTTVGQSGAPDPTLLNVSTPVFDLVFDGRGYVHALPPLQTWLRIHSVHIATNTESIDTGRFLWGGSRGRLHPSGDYLYTANEGLSPDDIEKWDIRTGTAVGLYDSPYHGDYSMCSNLWFSENGETIYTACGNTFRSNEVQAQDMVYSGALALTRAYTYNWRIRSLSQSQALGEIALIEHDYFYCEIAPAHGPCYEHLAYYESDFLNRLAVYGIGPLTVGGTVYAQRGLFVFHDAVGTNKYLLSRLFQMPNPDAEYYLSVVP